MRNLVRSDWVRTILIVLLWTLLLLIAFFYIRALMKESMWFDKGDTPIVELPDKTGLSATSGLNLPEMRLFGNVGSVSV